MSTELQDLQVSVDEEESDAEDPDGYTMDQAAALLAELPAPIPKDFERMRDSPGMRKHNNAEMLLGEYLAFVINFPRQWFGALPESWTCPTALGKGKAVLGALEKVCRKEEVCMDSWDDVKQALETIDAKVAKDEVHKRKARKKSSGRSEAPGSVCTVRKTGNVQSQSQVLRKACLKVAQGSMIGAMLTDIWESGAFPMEEPQVLLRAVKALYNDKDSIEAFEIVMGTLDDAK